MKYTRYNYKNKKNDMLILFGTLLFIVVTSVLLGTLLSNMFIKDSKTIKNNTIGPGVEANKNAEITSIKFIALQCGYFEQKENAEELKNKIKNLVVPFSIVDNNKIRIMAGIYDEKEAANVIKTLKDNNIDSAKMVFEIAKSDGCNSEIIEIINAKIEVLTKLKEKDVKSIKIEDLKKWTSSLKDVDKNSKNYSVLDALKKYINELPNELTKDKVESIYIYLYDILYKLKN